MANNDVHYHSLLETKLPRALIKKDPKGLEHGFYVASKHYFIHVQHVPNGVLYVCDEENKIRKTCEGRKIANCPKLVMNTDEIVLVAKERAARTQMNLSGGHQSGQNMDFELLGEYRPLVSTNIHTREHAQIL